MPRGSSDDMRQLKEALVELTKVSRDQYNLAREQARGGEGEPPGGGEGAKPGASPLMGFGASIARVYGQGGGPMGEALGSIAAGAASGGLAGAGLAAAGAAMNVASGYIGAGQKGYLNAPLFSGESRRQFEAQYAQKSFVGSIDMGLERMKLDAPARKLAGLFGKGFQGTKEQAELDERRERITRPIDAAVAQVDPFWHAYGVAGGKLDGKTRAIMDESLQIRIQRERQGDRFSRELVRLANDDGQLKAELERR